MNLNHVRTWPHTSSGKTKKTWRVDGATDHVPWGAGQGYKKQNYFGVVTCRDPLFWSQRPVQKKNIQGGGYEIEQNGRTKKKYFGGVGLTTPPLLVMSYELKLI